MKKKSSTAAPAAQELERGLKQARAMRAAGQRAEAVTRLRELLAKTPNSWEGQQLLGECLAELGRWQAALAAFEFALALSPKQALTHARAGEAAYHLGDWPRAELAYASAVALDRGLAAGWRNLGLTRMLQSRLLPALEAYLVAFQLEPQHPDTRRNLAHLLARPEIYQAPICAEPQPWKPLLMALLKDPHQWHQGLAPVVASQILVQAPAEGLLRPERDELLQALLSLTINVSLPLEARLRALRAQYLTSVASGAQTSPGHLSLLGALALQAFHNESLWPESAVERELLDQWAPGLAERDAPTILAFAMFRPLHTQPGAVALLRAPIWNGGLESLRTRLLAEPLQERLLAAEMPALTPIHDATSRAVQDQYEEHPFPRWTNLATVLPTLAENFRKYLGVTAPAHLEDAPEILIAGCGTGQHPISVAIANPRAQVTAIDLSRASLAFGKRMAARMGLTNVNFAQADMLELTDWDRRFDHIESVGVLHHMAEPLAGWRMLRRLLRPHGTMRIGVYSERARQGVIEARALIEREGLRGDLAGIRELRERIIREPGLRPLLEQLLGLDFFATSTLRDLIFHVYEQRYTPTRLADELTELGMRFLGFELNGGPAREAFSARFPDDPRALDLSHWELIEAEYPQTFTGMYVLWATPA